MRWHLTLETLDVAQVEPCHGDGRSYMPRSTDDERPVVLVSEPDLDVVAFRAHPPLAMLIVTTTARDKPIPMCIRMFQI